MMDIQDSPTQQRSSSFPLITLPLVSSNEEDDDNDALIPVETPRGSALNNRSCVRSLPFLPSLPSHGENRRRDLGSVFSTRALPHSVIASAAVARVEHSNPPLIPFLSDDFASTPADYASRRPPTLLRRRHHASSPASNGNNDNHLLDSTLFVNRDNTTVQDEDDDDIDLEIAALTHGTLSLRDSKSPERMNHALEDTLTPPSMLRLAGILSNSTPSLLGTTDNNNHDRIHPSTQRSGGSNNAWNSRATPTRLFHSQKPLHLSTRGPPVVVPFARARFGEDSRGRHHVLAPISFHPNSTSPKLPTV
ncbi:expressed unknown protein [Seminavis robusta]|uniref:Uncharacterized protein n=1 Tax=Seminavis robusta TaxID=568900 RepID=A0A9N8EM69_9STRA|nr:expressed unknown protein [Seminavis robusta]|eukprot:Sro1199_g251710.1 n/a (306) ;mRNA; r:9921-10838